ncbi:hypothetical protein EAI_08108 [Harpegnathos saltator]|uniref:Uncharacterized protein n=1 Tax=Harpegnathos saltator TaxID=610380 RepID=E2C1G0_HARSA|nr:hypothetical protein EAI_08108 [Harpegnathos saltator]
MLSRYMSNRHLQINVLAKVEISRRVRLFEAFESRACANSAELPLEQKANANLWSTDDLIASGTRSKSSVNEISLPSSGANGITLSSLATIILALSTGIGYVLWATSFFDDDLNYKSVANEIYSLENGDVLILVLIFVYIYICVYVYAYVYVHVYVHVFVFYVPNSLAALVLSHNPRLQSGKEPLRLNQGEIKKKPMLELKKSRDVRADGIYGGSESQRKTKSLVQSTRRRHTASDILISKCRPEHKASKVPRPGGSEILYRMAQTGNTLMRNFEGSPLNGKLRIHLGEAAAAAVYMFCNSESMTQNNNVII